MTTSTTKRKREEWNIPPEFKRRMHEVARVLRKSATPTEATLWQELRKKRLDGRKFRRQVPIGPFVVDFFCASERLVVEVDGPIHDSQLLADKQRQDMIESLGIRFVRLKNEEVEQDLLLALDKIGQMVSD